MNSIIEDWIIKNRVRAVSFSISLFFLVAIALSFKLWLPAGFRQFPLIPYFIIFDKPYQLISISALVILIASLSISLFNKSRVWLLLIILSTLYLELEDQVRWQPWVYIYLVIFICKITSSNKSHFNDEHFISCVQILLIGIYFWSGIHKINSNFIDQTFTSIIKSVFLITDKGLITSLKPIGYFIPCTEIICSILLAIPQTRIAGLIVASLIHISILAFISPLGINTNHIIVPWNFAMIIMIIAAFYQGEKSILHKTIRLGNMGVQFVVILFFWVMPFLNFFSLWDSFPSFSLYSDKINGYYIAVEQSQLYRIDDKLTKFFVKIPNLTGGELIDVNKWTMSVLNVPFYPEDRVFKKLSKHFCYLGIDNEKLIFLKVSNYPIKGQYSSFKCK